ncbi:alpha/beta hydrolase [Tomitella biformata]|uniref:alpha/beta hydrolase n=1 Tax=Tomitella biformata TaxID=630403 RepID=UPI0004644FDF|nr:alpha/beta hydrolase [Tomitella biformata]
MRPTLTQLRAWVPESMIAAATRMGRRVDEFDDSMDAVRRASTAVSESWRGVAAESACGRMDAESTIGNRMAVAGLEVVEAINQSVSRLEAVRKEALAIELGLTSMGVDVGDNGEILGGVTRREERALASRLVAALDRVDDADRMSAASLNVALQRFANVVEYDSGHQSSREEVLARLGPVPTDAAALSDYWQSISVGDRADLLVADPSIGSRPGMPAATRDYFNRERLDELVAEATAERDRLAGGVDRGPGVGGGGGPDLELESARMRLAGYEAVAEQRSDPRALLLDIDDRGHAAVALNNPDTATHVTTLVPGTGSNLTTIGGLMDRAGRMLDVGAADSPNARHSVALFMGFDPPPNLIEAADSSYVEKGGPALREFQSGLRASHVGSDSYNTVVGHSIGATTVAYAASRGHSLDADALVFVGSPGSTVGHVTDLSLTGVDPSEIGDRVFSTKAPGDLVGLVGHAGPRANDTLDAGGWLAGLLVPGGGTVFGQLMDLTGNVIESGYDGSGPHGVDPADTDRFGGRRFTATFGDSGRSHGIDTDSHNEYWDYEDGRPVPALDNMGRIISGHGGTVY